MRATHNVAEVCPGGQRIEFPNIEMATITSLGSTHHGWSLSLYMRENPIMFLVFASSDREKTQATGESE